LNRYFIDTYHQSDIIIRNNKKDIPLFISSGIDEKKIFHVEYGYDNKKYFPISKIESRRIIGIASQKRIILNIGRLSDEKGQKYLIEAMNSIAKKKPDVVCYIGGTGPSHDLLQKQIVELHLENNIKLIGFIPDESMSLWMNTADLFVLPSLTEGNPTVMFECLGCGIPFIGTRVGGVPEVINSDDYGLLVDPGNSNDLAEKILIGLEREWDRKKILQYADQYSSEKISKQIISIYNSISKGVSS
jgi:glycosyltransferase involved in cell wall biosynthesis